VLKAIDPPTICARHWSCIGDSVLFVVGEVGAMPAEVKPISGRIGNAVMPRMLSNGTAMLTVVPVAFRRGP
jgi:hypothetical protein